MDKGPEVVRKFVFWTVIYVLLDWVVAAMTYPLMLEKVQSAFLKVHGIAFFVSLIGFSSVITLLLAYLIVRMRSVLAVWITVTFFILANGPRFIFRERFFSTGMSFYLFFLLLIVRAYGISILFNPGFRRWIAIDAKK